MLAAAWSLLDEARSREARDTGVAVFGAAPIAGSIAGPIVGGLAAQETTWRLALVAELALVVILVWRVRRQPRVTRAPSPSIDWANSLAIPSGAAAVLVGVGLADEYGWWTASRPLDAGSVHIAPFGISIVPLLIGVGVLVLFWTTARAARVRLAAFARPRFLAALVIGLSVGTVTMGTFYALRLYLAIGPKLDVLAVGLSLAPFGLGAILVNILVFQTKWPANARVGVGAGIVISTVGVGLVLGGVAVWGTGLGSAPGLFVLGAGNGLVASRLSLLTLSTVDPDQHSEASSIGVGANDLAYALGIAVLGAVFVGVAAHAIVSGIERQLIERQLALPPAVRQQIEARFENELRTLSPAQQDAFLQSQPPKVRAAIQSVSDRAFKQGVEVTLETALGGLGLAFVLVLISGPPREARVNPGR